MDRSFSKEIEEILREKFPDVIVEYWGHDPDDLEIAPDSEDGWSGSYDAYMAASIDYEWFEKKCIEKKLPFVPGIIFHSPDVTKQYYPEIYNEYLRRSGCQNS